MRIEHLALYVNDLEANREFFEKYFGAASGCLYQNEETGFKSYFLTFGGGSRLELMTRPILEDNPKSEIQTGYIHMAFSVGSKAKVDSLTKELENEGYKVISGPRMTGDGYYESCIIGPENNQIEITV